MTAASSLTVRDRDFLLRPHPRPADILMVTRGGFSMNQLSLGGGMLGTYCGLVVASPSLGNWRPFFAAEVYGTDGPFENGERLAEEDGNFLGCEDLHFTLGAAIHLQATATFYF